MFRFLDQHRLVNMFSCGVIHGIFSKTYCIFGMGSGIDMQDFVENCKKS